MPASDEPVFTQAATELDDYLAGERRSFTVPVATAGDAFQEQVWARLREIPYGETTTYGTLAVELGNPALAQRVGQAVGHNPLSIIVPCHRVVGADGKPDRLCRGPGPQGLPARARGAGRADSLPPVLTAPTCPAPTSAWPSTPGLAVESGVLTPRTDRKLRSRRPNPDLTAKRICAGGVG